MKAVRSMWLCKQTVYSLIYFSLNSFSDPAFVTKFDPVYFSFVRVGVIEQDVDFYATFRFLHPTPFPGGC